MWGSVFLVSIVSTSETARLFSACCLVDEDFGGLVFDAVEKLCSGCDSCCCCRRHLPLFIFAFQTQGGGLDALACCHLVNNGGFGKRNLQGRGHPGDSLPPLSLCRGLGRKLLLIFSSQGLFCLTDRVSARQVRHSPSCLAFSHQLVDFHPLVETQLLRLFLALAQPLLVLCLHVTVMSLDENFVQVGAVPFYHVLVSKEPAYVEELVQHACFPGLGLWLLSLRLAFWSMLMLELALSTPCLCSILCLYSLLIPLLLLLEPAEPLDVAVYLVEQVEDLLALSFGCHVRPFFICTQQGHEFGYRNPLFVKLKHRGLIEPPRILRHISKDLHESSFVLWSDPAMP